MVVKLFVGAPSLVPITELLERHRAGSLALTTRGTLTSPELVLSDGQRGHDLVTEVLRLAAAGHTALQAAAEQPTMTVGELGAKIRTADHDLQIYLARG